MLPYMGHGQKRKEKHFNSIMGTLFPQFFKRISFFYHSFPRLHAEILMLGLDEAGQNQVKHDQQD